MAATGSVLPQGSGKADGSRFQRLEQLPGLADVAWSPNGDLRFPVENDAFRNADLPARSIAAYPSLHGPDACGLLTDQPS